ncbi:MAG: glycoside hydrolase family 55 protein [Alphaproteobacteria bacterium]|nr:glycoside hydrolase family 55 protein [Alphaproteobacteria bacterium]
MALFLLEEIMPHIQIPPVTPIVRYLADGIETVFTYPFPIFASEDLKVYINGAEQISGYDITGAGATAGGSVTFDAAPAEDSIITLARVLPLERLTDFIEGGDFSAQAINTELDFMMASLQQVDRANGLMLHYGDHETPGLTELPAKSIRKNKALGFDGDGNPVAVSLAGSMAMPDYTVSGTGAQERSVSDRVKEIVSVKDFGAVGDGLADDTVAFQNALNAHESIMIPSGSYLISGTLEIGNFKALLGLGQSSVIKCQSQSFDAIHMIGKGSVIHNLRIEDGNIAIKLYGKTSECTQNLVSDVQIAGAESGLVLDGYTSGDNPCYWNTFRNILIEQPGVQGVHLTKSGAGDTPNANRFYAVRVYSKGATTSGSGFYVENGSLNNSFVDCEANVNGTTADACFRVGADSDKTLIVNLLCESNNSVPNLQLDAGSVETAVLNLSAQSDGAAILDNSGGNYDALNAGYPEKNRLRQTVVTDLKATLFRQDTEYINTTGTVSLDLSHSVHLVSAYGGAVTIELPNAAGAPGAVMIVKKVDDTSYIVTVTEDGGAGPDGKTIQLGGENDYVTVLSNGAEWYIVSSNRMSGNTRYADTTGTYDIDMAVDTYLISSYGGAVTARLPPANAAEAIGRTITIKKTDSSGNAVTVTEQGGAGPDQSSQSLSSQYKAITVISNGGQWYVVSRY